MNWAEFLPLCRKTKTNTRACTTRRKNTMKSQIRPHLSVAKHGLLSNSDRAEAIQCCLHKPKTACRCPITYAFTWRCWHCTRAAWPATAHTGPRKSTCFPCRGHACIYDALVFFVYILVIILTLWVPFSSTNRQPCRKKSILAKVCFDAKRG